MKNFTKYNFNISKIVLCITVKAGTAKKIHTNRATHGLVYQLSGASEFRFDSGEVLHVNANDVLYLPKFSNYKVDEFIKGDCIAINFDIEETEKTFSPFILKGNDASAVYFKKSTKAWERKRDGYLNICYQSLYAIICNIQDSKNKEYIPSNHKKIAGAGRDEILKNLSDTSLSIEAVSNDLGITPEYFRQLFKKAFGMSPRKFIIEKRIEKAKELIASDEFKINEISKLCGYASNSYFCKEFKRETSYSPMEYKKKSTII